MNLTKTAESIEDTVSGECRHAADWVGPAPDDASEPILDEARRVVEQIWSMKSMTQWTRDDSGLLNALRWDIWDRFKKGHPPSRIEVKTGSAVTA